MSGATVEHIFIALTPIFSTFCKFGNEIAPPAIGVPNSQSIENTGFSTEIALETGLTVNGLLTVSNRRVTLLQRRQRQANCSPSTRGARLISLIRLDLFERAIWKSNCSPSTSRSKSRTPPGGRGWVAPYPVELAGLAFVAIAH
jgi:hypothetical protein